MKISLNWLSDYLDTAPIRANLRDVLAKLTMRGLEVESVQDLSQGFDKVVVGLIEVRDRHPNADRLSVCRVNNGKEVLQIVCGAQNMKAGDKVALSMIGAQLPNGLKIEKGKIRDVDSFGMLCSETELAIAEESEGIMILPTDAQVGAPVGPLLGRDDIVFELNVTPNRGDALSHLGVARVLASITGQKLKTPAAKLAETGTDAKSKIKVTLLDDESCYQYHARYIEGVKVGPSPKWLQKRLMALGMRPISNVVDVTNFILMDMGQPLHAFDYGLIKGSEIKVRRAKDGETIPLLDKTEAKLTVKDLVIADGERAVALAGVMGGANSEVSTSTTRILLEGAQFAPGMVGASSKRHQKHTDSSHRFERQVDPRQVRAALDRAAALIAEVSGATVGRGVVSQFGSGFEKKLTAELPSVKVSAKNLNDFLGTALTDAQIEECLENAGFSAKAAKDQIQVTVPSFRFDVSLAQDIYEEVLSVWGYDKVESRVPLMQFIPEASSKLDHKHVVLDKVRQALVQLGFSEAVNFAFTSKKINEFWGGEHAAKAPVLQNPLNEEFAILKTSLLGGLFTNFMTAINHQSRDVRLFEVRPVYYTDANQESGVREEWRVAALFCGRNFSHALAAHDREADFFDAKGALESVLDTLMIRGLRIAPLPKADPRFHPAQAAEVTLGRGPCGVLARLHPKIESENKIRQPVYALEISLDRLVEMTKSERKVVPIAKFPKAERALSLLKPKDMSADKILAAMQKHGKPFIENIAVSDVYSGPKIPEDQQSLSISFWFSEPNRTLEDQEIEKLVQAILAGLDKDLGVKLRVE